LERAAFQVPKKLINVGYFPPNGTADEFLQPEMETPNKCLARMGKNWHSIIDSAVAISDSRHELAGIRPRMRALERSHALA